MDHINAFNLYGQAGVGVDVAFLFVEAGYNYGFIDLFKNDVKSNPNQIFINLGFRFLIKINFFRPKRWSKKYPTFTAFCFFSGYLLYAQNVEDKSMAEQI